MPKYNFRVKKEKPATYRTQVSPEVIDHIYEQILRKMIVEKKYKDPDYTAKKLAEEIQTNTRYISAAVSLRFQMNYSELIGGYRVREAINLLTDKRTRDLTMAQVAAASGFANRQSMYASFFRLQHTTPKQYQADFFAKLEASKASKKAKNKQ